MNDENIISSEQIISSFFDNLETDKIKENTNILKAWSSTVQKISGNGPQLCDHSRVVDFKKGILLIETDHPAWSQMLQLHKKFILTGINKFSGGIKIDTLAFRVRGSNASLSNREGQEEITKKEMEKYCLKLGEREKILEEKGFLRRSNENVPELPDELKEIFERMKSKKK